MGHFPWTAISLNMTDSYHPSTRAAGCVQVNQVIQVAVMQQQAMTAKNSAASKGDNGVHILQAQVIENALETWKYEVQILKYPQITILETQFLASFKKGSGNTGEPCARWKSCFTKTCCTSSHQNHQCPNGNSSINRWFYMIFTYFPIKSTKKKTCQSHHFLTIPLDFPIPWRSHQFPMSMLISFEKPRFREPDQRFQASPSGYAAEPGKPYVGRLNTRRLGCYHT